MLSQIAMFQFQGEKKLQILSIDDLVNLKWNVMKLVCEENEDYKSKYTSFFEDQNSKRYVNKFAFNKIDLELFFTFLTVRMDSLREIVIPYNSAINQLEENNSKVRLGPGDNLVKIFKTIFYLSALEYEDKNKNKSVIFDVKYIFTKYGSFMHMLIKKFFREDQKQNFIVALKNIDKIECDDQVFKEFQECCKDLNFDNYISCWGIKCDNDTVETEEKVNSKSVDSNTEQKLSTKKLLLLISTVIFVAATAFFAINFVLAFLALEKILAIVLAVLTTIAFVTFLAISIKNDVINKPQFLGGEKSFIDLYQNEENKEEKPDLDEINKEKEHDM